MQENKAELKVLIEKAILGDEKSLEILLTEVQNTVFNLSLRMLGTVTDAEDATQDILIRIMTNLSSFRMESSFSTWVYRLSINFLINYKKSMFSHYPLDFEFYGNDIRFAQADSADELIEELSREQLAAELKMSCTNVMLQCLDTESRCIFILGTMFKIDSHTASEILDISPESYRQKLSRIRKKVAGFLSYHCGLTETGFCRCSKRVDYAVSQKRINPKKLEYSQLETLDKQILDTYTKEMEKLEALSDTFEKLPNYKSPKAAYSIIQTLLQSAPFNKIQSF